MGQYKPKTPGRGPPPVQRALIVHKYQDGYIIADIHREFKTPRSTIRSILDRYQNYTGFEFKNKPRCGVKPNLTSAKNKPLFDTQTRIQKTLFLLLLRQASHESKSVKILFKKS